MNKSSVNVARSIYYGLMSKMLVFSPDISRFDGVSEVLDILIQNQIDENSCEALKEIKEFIKVNGEQALSDEFDEIFNNPATTEIRDTASYYDEGVESGKKRVTVISFLGKTKIRRNEKVFAENEDSIGFLVTFMHELIELIINGESQYETVQHCLYTEVINEFIDEYIVSLYEHENANAYKSFAVVLNAFIEFERLYFNVRKPEPKERVATKEPEKISEMEAKRRAENRKKREADSSRS